MRDKTHMEQVEKWAFYVRANPDWKNKHTQFINSLYGKASKFIHALAKQKNGKDKIIKLYGIKNIEGYKKLLR
jgi:hypothetical protein